MRIAIADVEALDLKLVMIYLSQNTADEGAGSVVRVALGSKDQSALGDLTEPGHSLNTLENRVLFDDDEVPEFRVKQLRQQCVLFIWGARQRKMITEVAEL